MTQDRKQDIFDKGRWKDDEIHNDDDDDGDEEDGHGDGDDEHKPGHERNWIWLQVGVGDPQNISNY